MIVRHGRGDLDEVPAQFGPALGGYFARINCRQADNRFQRASVPLENGTLFSGKRRQDCFGKCGAISNSAITVQVKTAAIDF